MVVLETGFAGNCFDFGESVGRMDFWVLGISTRIGYDEGFQNNMIFVMNIVFFVFFIIIFFIFLVSFPNL